MIDYLITFGALTFGIVLVFWISLRSLPNTSSDKGRGKANLSVSHLIGRSLVVFLAVLGAFFVLEKSIGLNLQSSLTPFHAGYGAALIIFVRGMLLRQSNNGQQRAGTD